MYHKHYVSQYGLHDLGGFAVFSAKQIFFKGLLSKDRNSALRQDKVISLVQ